MRKIKHLKRLLTVVLFGLLVISLLTLTLFYTFKFKADFLDESIRYLNEVSAQSVVTLNSRIDSDLKYLSGISSLISNQPLKKLNDFNTQLNKIAETNNYKRLGVIDPKGKVVYSTDHSTMFLGDRDFFLKSIQGSSNVSDILYDKSDGGHINVYSVPIYSDDQEVIGVLFATYKIDDYQQNLAISSFGGEGYSCIIDSFGTVIIGSNYPEVINSQISIFDLIVNSHGNDPDESKKMYKNIANGKSGTIFYYHSGEPKYMNYSPLRDNGWYLLSIVPESIINAKYSLATKYTITLGIIIIVIFICLLTITYFLQRKSKNDFTKLAFNDPVTDGNNLSWFLYNGEKILSKKTLDKYAIIEFDVKDFKYINDVFGFQEGNRALKFLYNIAKSIVKNDELVVRTNGDCFLMLIQYTSPAAFENKLVDFLLQITRESEHIDKKYNLIVFAGVYIIENKNIDLPILVDRASIARQSVKHKHYSSFAFYSSSMREKVIKEKQIEIEMADALANGEFEVFYQPKYDIPTSQMSGAEALVRWRHPIDGLIAPDKFIPLFEKNGFINQLDTYVFEQVCKSICKWISESKHILPISINVSRLHLYNPNFVFEYYDIVRKYGISTNNIELELTESVFFDNADVVINIMSSLHRLGFWVSMDDFGAGYSSLNMLKLVPVDVLKLDREFLTDTTQNERGQEIITAIISLAKRLDIRVVAEGVETLEQLEILRAAECDYAQGYFFSKPIQINEFEAMLSTNVSSTKPHLEKSTDGLILEDTTLAGGYSK